ncbi:Uncharacterised protein [Mycobacterium tuberculosis]|nr:Uncharacterised protein [Mycobacterium tuberculosis]
MGVLPQPLADGEHVDAVFGDLDRGAEPGASGTDHEDGGGDLSFGCIHALDAS